MTTKKWGSIGAPGSKKRHQHCKRIGRKGGKARRRR